MKIKNFVLAVIIFIGIFFGAFAQAEKDNRVSGETAKHGASDFRTNLTRANAYFESGDYDNARRYFEICDRINNRVSLVVNRLIQIRYRQGDLDGVETYKNRLREIRRTSGAEGIRNLRYFTIDIFEHNDMQIHALEAFDLSGDLYYHWTFRIFDSENRFVKSVNLESSSILRAFGTSYVVGTDRFENNRRIHQTTGITFTELPDYSVMKNIVIEAIEKGLEADATGVYPMREGR